MIICDNADHIPLLSFHMYCLANGIIWCFKTEQSGNIFIHYNVVYFIPVRIIICIDKIPRPADGSQQGEYGRNPKYLVSIRRIFCSATSRE